MFLKRRTRTKDGKTHACYSVCESLRICRDRVVPRQRPANPVAGFAKDAAHNSPSS